MWEKDINIHEVREIRSRTTVYFGVGAIAKIADICKDLKAKGLDKIIVMTGRGAYKKTGAWDYVTKAFEDNGISYVHYDKVTPPIPTTLTKPPKWPRTSARKQCLPSAEDPPLTRAKA